MVRLSGQRGVPVTNIDGQIIVGYDRPRLDSLLASAQKPRLGAAIASASEMAAKGLCQTAHGAYLGKVRPDGAAARAGLLPGDVIVSFADRQVSSALHLEQLIAGLSSGQTVSVGYVRGADRRDTPVRF